MKLYLVRHPRTKRNKNNLLTGWERTPYSKTGKIQFEKILKFFKGTKLEIYSSDLPRAYKLAKEISKQNKVKLYKSKLLREQNFKDTKPLWRYETKKKFEKRIDSLLKKMLSREGIILSHSGVIKIILTEVANKEKAKEFLRTKRDTIALIETNKKGRKLRFLKIQ